MLLALLMLVVGLLGGALPGAPMLPLDTERAIMSGGGADRPMLSMEGALLSSGVAARKCIGMAAGGGGTLLLRVMGGGGVAVGGGGVAAETERVILLGGGGVAVFAGVFSAPDFLLTHRLRSGS